jgi:hypothetical protein
MGSRLPDGYRGGGHSPITQPKCPVHPLGGVVPLFDHQRRRLMTVQGLGEEKGADVPAQALPAGPGWTATPASRPTAGADQASAPVPFLGDVDLISAGCPLPPGCCPWLAAGTGA